MILQILYDLANIISAVMKHWNNIQPTFTARAKGNISSSAIIPIFSTSTILLPCSTSQLVLQSTSSTTLSTTASIQHTVSSFSSPSLSMVRKTDKVWHKSNGTDFVWFGRTVSSLHLLDDLDPKTNNVSNAHTVCWYTAA